MSTAPLLAFLDADDVWHPKMLEVNVAAFEARPDAGAVHCGLEEVDVSGRVLAHRVQGHGGWVAEELLLLKSVVPLTGSASLIRRDVFESVGGYDERLSTSADWELCLRVALGNPMVFVEEALVSYTVHDSNMHGNLRAMEHDVLLGFQKAFDARPDLQRLRRRAMSSLYMTLSGSHLSSNEYRRALECAVKSVRFEPARAVYVLGLPARRLRRRAAAT